MRRISSRLVQVAIVVAILTAVAASPAAATKTIKGKTIKNLRITNGTHDIIYDKCTFKGGGAKRAVIEIRDSALNITFRDCVIESGGGWNGVSINDRSGNVHDITFKRCRIKKQGRMGLECTSRPVSDKTGYRNIRIIKCIFAPQGSQAISFDGGTGCVDNVIDRTVVRGAGVNLKQQFGAGVEVNGPRRFRFTNNKVYQCRGSLLNLQMHTTEDCGWVFNNNVLNASKRVQKVKMDPLAQVVSAEGVHGGNFRNNTVIAAKPGAGVAWWGECVGMDWSGTVWKDTGARGLRYLVPLEEDGSSGNKF